MNARASLSLLRCSAGGVPFGIAAAEVVEFRPAEASPPHLGRLLGFAGVGDEQKTLRLQGPGAGVLINVDGPVRIRPLTGAEILTRPAFFARAALGPIVGFAEEDGRVVLLLDARRVARLAVASSTEGDKS